MLELIGIFFLLVFIFSFIQGYNSKQPKGQKNKANQPKNTEAIRFLPPIPKGFGIIESNIYVAGLFKYKQNALKFMKDSNQVLELERDVENEFDKNAIKVIGKCSSARDQLGYIPKEIAGALVETQLINEVFPRLVRIYKKGDYLEIQFQIIGPKKLKEVYVNYFNHLVATEWQRLFCEFFNIELAEEATVEEADTLIKDYSEKLNEEDPVKLSEFEAYVDILNELMSESTLDIYSIKKPSKKEIDITLNQLIRSGSSYTNLRDDPDLVISELLKNNPKLNN